VAKLSAKAVYEYALGAGFAGEDALDAVRIAYRESTLDPNATNGHDFGLWQINQVHDTAANRQRFGFTKKQDWFDPELNARMAFALFQSNRWNDWAAGPGGFTPVSKGGDPFYKTPSRIVVANEIANGDDNDRGPGGIIPDPKDVVDGVGDVVGGIAGAIAPWAEGLAKLLSVIVNPDWWRRIGIGVLGALVLVAALATAL
jgi:hypothetical protein